MPQRLDKQKVICYNVKNQVERQFSSLTDFFRDGFALEVSIPLRGLDTWTLKSP